MTGEPFGPYQLESLLGRGGMGEVYRAYDTVQKRVVALKLLSRALTDDIEFRSRFRREAEIAARLSDPHVIPIHRYGEIDGRLYLDMRLVTGRDLAELLRAEGALPAHRAAGIVEQVASALDAAHEAGLVHRDVKPANVFLVRSRQARGDFAYLGDFGIARLVDETTSGKITIAGTTLGTPAYMAPEQFLGETVDRYSDVYALTCVVYECLTGAPPFVRDTVAALMYAHIGEPPPAPSERNPDLPRSLDDLVARGMAKDRRERFPTAGDLADALAAAVTPPAPAPPVASHGAGPDAGAREKIREASAAIARDPRDHAARARRAEAYRLAGLYDDALRDFDRALELKPDYAWALGSRADTYRNMGRYDEAIADYDRAIELLPRARWLSDHRGLAHRHSGQYEEALRDFGRALEIDPASSWTLAARGETYRMLKRYDEALQDLDQALERRPDDVWSLGARCGVHRALRHYRAAMDDITRALRHAERPEAWLVNYRGACHEDQGRLEDASADYRRAAALDPAAAYAVRNHAFVMLATGQLREAYDWFSRALDREPRNERALSGRAEVLRRWGRYDEAGADLAAIADGDVVATTRYRRGLLWTSRARPSEAAAEFAGAARLGAQEVDGDPEDPELVLWMVVFCAARTSWNAAESWAARAKSMRPGAGHCRYALVELRTLASADESMRDGVEYLAGMLEKP